MTSHTYETPTHEVGTMGVRCGRERRGSRPQWGGVLLAATGSTQSLRCWREAVLCPPGVTGAMVLNIPSPYLVLLPHDSLCDSKDSVLILSAPSLVQGTW